MNDKELIDFLNGNEKPNKIKLGNPGKPSNTTIWGSYQERKPVEGEFGKKLAQSKESLVLTPQQIQRKRGK